MFGPPEAQAQAPAQAQAQAQSQVQAQARAQAPARTVYKRTQFNLNSFLKYNTPGNARW